MMSTTMSYQIQIYNLSVKETWFAIMEVWSYLDDVDVPHWKEEWEAVEDAEFICLNCGAEFSTNANFKMSLGNYLCTCTNRTRLSSFRR